MIVDILHQLLKEVVSIHLFQWLKSIISTSYSETQKQPGVKKSLEKVIERVYLDQQFYDILLFLNLK